LLTSPIEQRENYERDQPLSTAAARSVFSVPSAWTTLTFAPRGDQSAVYNGGVFYPVLERLSAIDDPEALGAPAVRPFHGPRIGPKRHRFIEHEPVQKIYSGGAVVRAQRRTVSHDTAAFCPERKHDGHGEGRAVPCLVVRLPVRGVGAQEVITVDHKA